MGWIETNTAGTKWRGKIRRDGRKVSGPWCNVRHEAEAWWREAEGTPAEPKAPARLVTLADYATDWLARRTNLAASTMAYQRTMITRGILDDPIGKLPIGDLDHRVVGHWVKRMDQAGPSARAGRLKALRAVYRDAMLDADCPLKTDPAPRGTFSQERTTKKRQTKRVYLSHESVADLLAQAEGDSRFQLLILLGVDAGLRWAEMAALNVSSVISVGNSMYLRIWQTVDRKGIIRNDTKNHEERTVPVTSARLRKALLAACREARLRGEGDGRDALLLAAPKGQRFGKMITRPTGKVQASYVDADGQRVYRECATRAEAQVWLTAADPRPVTMDPLRYSYWTKRKLQPAFKAAGIYPQPQGWHDLRHTYGSDLAAQGTPTKVIASLMGHSDVMVTEIYLHHAAQAVLEGYVAAAHAGR